MMPDCHGGEEEVKPDKITHLEIDQTVFLRPIDAKW